MNNCKKEIKNENSYFRTVIKNMDIDDCRSQNKINDNEVVLERREYENLGDNLDCEKQLYNQQFLGWIELIENSSLYEAVKSLPVKDQIFLSYIIKEQRTQRELAQLYNMAQASINLKFKNIKKKILRKLTNKH